MTNRPIIEIDEGSGFCFGVVNAIKHAEKELAKTGELYCLGDIVHNAEEVDRLSKMGMQTIDYKRFEHLHHSKVLFRAHGEPPTVYEEAKKRGLQLVDATCPVVLSLQRRIRKRYDETRSESAQIVIYGKRGHAEVNGLVGQTNQEAIVIQSIDELNLLDFARPIILFSQTTMSLEGFDLIIKKIKERIADDVTFEYHDTICRQVANRMPHIAEFASAHDLVVFVAGRKSSNGKVLYGECLKANPRSVFISSPDEITADILFPMPRTIGICGATSTPKWQMQQAQNVLESLLDSGIPDK